MKFISLISGGKDSLHNHLLCCLHSHTPICLGHLSHPKEMDSFMYQTVGTEAIPLIAQCLDLPIIIQPITGSPINQELQYEFVDKDETEDLFSLLEKAKQEYSIQGVGVGAILSDYQRLRVESVCRRLGLTVLAFLWKREQKGMLREMVEDAQMDIRLVKICSMGLKRPWLGRQISGLVDNFEKMVLFQKKEQQFGFNVCGEGGEYETLTFNSLMFKKFQIEAGGFEIVDHNDIAPVAYLKYTDLNLVEKSQEKIEEEGQIYEQFKEQILQRELSKHVIVEDVQQNNQLQKEIKLHFDKDINSFQVSNNLFMSSYISDSNITGLFQKIQNCLQKNELSLKQLTYIKLYIDDMSKFAEYNKIYNSFFSNQPPVRVCVTLPQGEIKAKMIGNKKEKKNLHVQSLSSWAPANIGPYSQCNLSENYLFIAGQIGMKPEDLALENSIFDQYARIKKNFDFLCEDMLGKIDQNQFLDFICYFGPEVKNSQQMMSMIEKDFPGMNKMFLNSGTLPKNSLIEIEILAQKNIQSREYQTFQKNIQMTQSSDDLGQKFQSLVGKLEYGNFEKELHDFLIFAQENIVGSSGIQTMEIYLCESIQVEGLRDVCLRYFPRMMVDVLPVYNKFECYCRIQTFK